VDARPADPDEPVEVGLGQVAHRGRLLASRDRGQG
jgi:hypothetical protein